MLKVGSVYTPKRSMKIDLIKDNIWVWETIGHGEHFTVLEYITCDEEKEEYADYIILFKGEKWHLSVEKQNWKAVAYDFKVIC